MKFLIIGSGGREHAIAWKLVQGSMVSEVFVSPGNVGTESETKCTNISAADYDELVSLAITNSIDMTVIGPEVPVMLLQLQEVTPELIKKDLKFQEQISCSGRIE